MRLGRELDRITCDIVFCGSVETSQAGPGNLEVTVNNGQVPTSAQAQGNHTYAISFTPREAKLHILELKFNGENVPGIQLQNN